MKITKNSWEGGRNTDVSLDKIQPNQYVEGYNFELVENGEYLAAQNLLGTTKVKEVLDNSEILELGSFPNRYIINGTEYNCLTIFTVTDKFKIWCYNTQTTDLYELYEEDIPEDYIADNRIIGADVYPEGGVDFLYFTDFYNELRFLKCQIDFPYTPNFLSDFDISLLRRGANGTIEINEISQTGNLLTGTYQFAYRMVDPSNKRFTKWSSLTNPVHVYKEGDTSNDPNYAGIGLLSNKFIEISVTPSEEEADNFEFIQLAVIENVTETLPITASLQEILPFTGSSIDFAYKSNTKIGTIPIDDIVVDLAAIKTLKTVRVKQNRLFGANVKYYDLEADNGTPEVTSGSIATFTYSVSDTYSSDFVASTKKGYFRNEVYRYGLKFSDKYGNNRIFPLDLTGKITGNQITFGIPDMKFPTRSTSNDYSIWSTDNKLKALGLSLTGITNIPSWAVNVEVVRVERKKDILFQTPIVQMVTVQGVGAASNYPTKYSTYDKGNTNTTIAEAQPQTPGKVLVPKNLFFPEARNIIQNGYQSVTGSAYSTLRTKTEVRYQRIGDYDTIGVFPPESIYGTTPFNYTGAELLDIVDYALLKCKSTTFRISGSDTSGYFNGDFIETSAVGNFYALTESTYYFDSTWTGKTIPSSRKNIKLTDYEFLPTFSSGQSIAGKTVMDYEALQTKGVGFWQYKPNAQKMGVFQMGSELNDATGRAFKAATLNAVIGNGYVTSLNDIRYSPISAVGNSYVMGYAGYTDQQSYISQIPVGNIKLGLSDDRYGDLNSQHEYISTGAKYTFSNAEIETLLSGGDLSINLDVWGGDCFLSSFVYKVSDSNYSITNIQKTFTPPSPDSRESSGKKWGSYYLFSTSDGTDPVMCIPVAVKNAAQFIQVVLESEYNGEVVDQDITKRVSSENGFPIMSIDTEEALRSPLTYKYNINLNQENSQKIYLPKPQYGFEQNDFRARLVYTDLKIYNSDQAGFDIIRAGNFFDLEENRYSVTKLALAGDNLYAIQERGVVYVPTGERQIEQTDGGQLAVRSGEVITRPLVIDAYRGSQHMRGVIETGGVIIIQDNFNKSIYALAGQELTPITKDNDTIFRQLFENQIPEKNIIGFYDPVRRNYWMAIDGNVQIYNEKLQAWVGQHEFTGLTGGVYQNQSLYLTGKPLTALNVYTMYTGDENTLFEEVVIPRVKFCINPDESFSKTFDDFMIDASDRLSTADLEVQRESFLGNQTASGLNLDVLSVENNFRVKAPRSSDNARLRGMRLLFTAKWGDLISSVKSVWTKYRTSPRTPW